MQPDQLGAPTPCLSWDVRALIDHFIGTTQWWASVIAADEEILTIDTVSEDRLASYDTNIALALRAFRAGGALERTVKLPFGELPGNGGVGARCDRTVHAWVGSGSGYRQIHRSIANWERIYSFSLGRRSWGSIEAQTKWLSLVRSLNPQSDAGPADRLAAFLGRSV